MLPSRGSVNQILQMCGAIRTVIGQACGFYTVPADMELLEILGTQSDAQAGKRLNTTVAMTVALLAAFMGICKVRDDNINQSMRQVQANRVDQGRPPRPR